MLGYSEEDLLSVASLALLHDIGAYKTEDRLQLTEMDVRHPDEHAAYGSIFLREFSPLSSQSDVILFHHWRYEDRFKEIDGRLAPQESFLIHAADRLSVLFKRAGMAAGERIWVELEPLAGSIFQPEIIGLLLRLVHETDLIHGLSSGEYLDEIYDYFDKVALSTEQAADHLSTLVYAIDFRSRQTVTHSVSVVSATDLICDVMGLSPEQRETSHIAALLHDVGKIMTPLSVLAKPGRLTEEEMVVMREHVVGTEQILLGAGLEEIDSIASYHHERLDGGGYPHGSRADQLPIGARILAVADRFAALVEPRYYKSALPKEDVLRILGNSAASNHIDSMVYEVVRDHYDQLMAETSLRQKSMMVLYERLSAEYLDLTNQMHAVRFGEPWERRRAA
jgi:HD-GYP domain-containing protein (c-di-GMP phosphodiesterase class II)